MIDLEELQRLAAKFRAGISRFWCSWTHGGGNITRDPMGRINWQCARCGRWSDPVKVPHG